MNTMIIKKIKTNLKINLILLEFLILVLVLFFNNCKPINNELDEDILGVPTIPQDYCLSLDTIVVPSGTDPNLYGWICASTTEDKDLLSITNGVPDIDKLTPAQLRAILKNCKNYFFERDATPIASSNFNLTTIRNVVGAFSEEVTKYLPPDEIYNLLRNPTVAGASPKYTPPLSESKIMANIKGEPIAKLDGSTYTLNLERTFTLKDYRNHRIVLVFLTLFNSTDINGCSFLGGSGVFGQCLSDEFFWGWDGFNGKIGDTDFGNALSLLILGEGDFLGQVYSTQYRGVRMSKFNIISTGGAINSSLTDLISTNDDGLIKRAIKPRDVSAGGLGFNFSFTRNKCENPYSGPLDKYPVYPNGSVGLSAAPTANNGGLGTIENPTYDKTATSNGNSWSTIANCANVKISSLSVSGNSWPGTVTGNNQLALSGAICAYSSDITSNWNTTTALSTLSYCSKIGNNINGIWSKRIGIMPDSVLENNLFNLSNLNATLQNANLTLKSWQNNYSFFNNYNYVPNNLINGNNYPNIGYTGSFYTSRLITLNTSTSNLQIFFMPMFSGSGASNPNVALLNRPTSITGITGATFDSGTGTSYPAILSIPKSSIPNSNSNVISGKSIKPQVVFSSGSNNLTINLDVSWGACIR